MIKVLIVDDSVLIRKILTDILKTDSEVLVVGTARNGKEALEKIETLKPDIITMDIEMPLMDGITTLKHIVSRFKLPVIMISSLTSEGADLTLKALDEGAIDFLPKPSNIFGLNQADIKAEIIEKIKIGSKSRIDIKKPIKALAKPEIQTEKLKKTYEDFNSIVVIGTSTGGPRALQALIPEIPNDINAAIVIVQHMPAKFTKSLADRLNSTSNIQIKEAEDGDIISKGCGYIAPGDYHMTIVKESKNLVVRLNKDPQVMGLRPTVDILMESVANINGYSKVGVILTGMGSDGTKGIVKMKNSGSYNIAQDESTSVVYGMPKSAIASNCIDEILPLDKIALRITNKVGV